MISYRQGRNSPVNIWMDATYKNLTPGLPAGAPPTSVTSTHVCMATSESWARAIADALNQQYQRETLGLPAEATAQERALLGLQAFLHELDMHTDLGDVDPQLVTRLRRWCNEQKRTRSENP